MQNLYIRLTNLKGSTVAPPTTVQSQVLLTVGINPSKSRLKQLAQTITGSHTKNLGLDNTVFGRVKQVSLSSILQHSLGSDGSSPSPSPSPSPSFTANSHHHHRHHQHPDVSLSPGIAPSPSILNGGSVTGKRSPMSTPVPAPAPGKNKAAEPPACHFGYNNRYPWKHNKHSHTAPSASPVYAPHAAPSQPKQTKHITPKVSPVPAESPLPNVAHSHSLPPSHSEYHARAPAVMPLISPSPSLSQNKKHHLVTAWLKNASAYRSVKNEQFKLEFCW
ncbi:UNVERIFIED_CONTAM: hypothetical protein Sradi_4443900 [Sesamum radiatum]|uniref:DUF7036 domain-containing protein n=1 Tax=Sesamum radiatum TaxID=300843 RepID=A0AAW2NSD4_SESRA